MRAKPAPTSIARYPSFIIHTSARAWWQAPVSPVRLSVSVRSRADFNLGAAKRALRLQHVANALADKYRYVVHPRTPCLRFAKQRVGNIAGAGSRHAR